MLKGLIYSFHEVNNVIISKDRGFTGCFHYIWRRSMAFQTVAASYCLMVRISLTPQAPFSNLIDALLDFQVLTKLKGVFCVFLRSVLQHHASFDRWPNTNRRVRY